MERLKRRLRKRNVARAPGLFKIAVLMEDDRYYIRTEAGILQTGKKAIGLVSLRVSGNYYIFLGRWKTALALS